LSCLRLAVVIKTCFPLPASLQQFVKIFNQQQGGCAVRCRPIASKYWIYAGLPYTVPQQTNSGSLPAAEPFMPVLSFFPRKFPAFYGHGMAFSCDETPITLEDGIVKPIIAQDNPASGAGPLLLLFTPLWISAYQRNDRVTRLPRHDKAGPYRLDCPPGLAPATEAELRALHTMLDEDDRATLTLMLEGTQAAAPLVAALADGEAKTALLDHMRRLAFAAGKNAAVQAALEGRRADALAIAAATLEQLPAVPAYHAVPSKEAVKRGAILGDFSLPQCRHYRVEQKLEQFTRLGIAVDCIEMRDAAMLRQALPALDFLIIYRLPTTPVLLDIVSEARRVGLPLLYETDDLLFDADAFPGQREDYPAGFSAEEYAELQILPPMYLHAMALCDRVITSTPALMQRARDMLGHDRVAVHANGLGQRHQLAAAQAAKVICGTKDGTRTGLKLFYGSGTKAQQSDFATLADQVLVPFLAAHPDASLTVAGEVELPQGLLPYTPQLETLASQSLEGYWAALAEADVFLVPLARNAFNDCKSAIKWLEAANLGVMTVASRTPAFDAMIKSGTDGFLCAGPDEWRTALELLAAEPQKAGKMGALARSRAQADFSAERLDQSLTAIVASLRG
jgi:hypothetical protein